MIIAKINTRIVCQCQTVNYTESDIESSRQSVFLSARCLYDAIIPVYPLINEQSIAFP